MSGTLEASDNHAKNVMPENSRQIFQSDLNITAADSSETAVFRLPSESGKPRHCLPATKGDWGRLLHQRVSTVTGEARHQRDLVIHRAVMSATIGERHASACRYKNEVPDGSRRSPHAFLAAWRIVASCDRVCKLRWAKKRHTCVTLMAGMPSCRSQRT